MLIRAAVCHAFGEPLRIEEVELAPPGPGEVRVQVMACAVCHSDILKMDGAWGGDLPAVYGHEAAGIVEETGPGVEGPAVGDHVVVTLIRWCGRCYLCARGDQVLCRAAFRLDFDSPLRSAAGEPISQGLRTAAFAEQVVVDASQVVAIPRDIPLSAASLIACGVLTGYGAVVNTARVPAGSSVVVMGAGGVGLNSIQGAVLSGADPVIAVDPLEAKRRAALDLGAARAADPGEAAETVSEATSGGGADFVLVTTGSVEAIHTGLGLLGVGGTLVIVGMPPYGVAAAFEPTDLAEHGRRVIGSKMGSARIRVDVPAIVDHYRNGRLELDRLITGRYPLEEINQAVASSRRGEALRNVIVF